MASTGHTTPCVLLQKGGDVMSSRKNSRPVVREPRGVSAERIVDEFVRWADDACAYAELCEQVRLNGSLVVAR